jgi:nucleoside phosphorylase
LKKQGGITVLVSFEREIERFSALLKRVRHYRIQGKKALRGSLYGRDVMVILTGPGRSLPPEPHVRDAELVISTGICGGLVPSLRCGDIVVAEEVFFLGTQERSSVLEGAGTMSLQSLEVTESGCAFDLLSNKCGSVSFQAVSGRTVHGKTVHGKTVTVEKPLLSAAEKRKVGEKTGGISVDMEDFFRLEAARRLGAHFLSIRAVYDEASLDIRSEEGHIDTTRIMLSSESIADALSLVIEAGPNFA